MSPVAATVLAILAGALGVTVGLLSAPTTVTPTQETLVGLDGVERELASIREALEGLLLKPGPVLRGSGGDSPSPRLPVPHQSDQPPESPQPTRIAPGSLPELKSEPVQAISGWKEEAAVRQKWLFSTEKSVLEALGTPSRVYTAQGVDNEYWVYNLDGSVVTLTFRHGRLLDVKTEGQK